ncbi:uncharacterized protein [Argopecten irradians]|uniref:uncharacterized protein n=1 Tax=Argopecten irradians TaxID=31199 RepID=UPI00371653EF
MDSLHMVLLFTLLLGLTMANECNDIDQDFDELTAVIQSSRRNDELLLLNLPRVLEKIQCLDIKLNYLVAEVESMQRHRRSSNHPTRRATSTRKFIHRRNRH